MNSESQKVIDELEHEIDNLDPVDLGLLQERDANCSEFDRGLAEAEAIHDHQSDAFDNKVDDAVEMFVSRRRKMIEEGGFLSTFDLEAAISHIPDQESRRLLERFFNVLTEG